MAQQLQDGALLQLLQDWDDEEADEWMGVLREHKIKKLQDLERCADDAPSWDFLLGDLLSARETALRFNLVAWQRERGARSVRSGIPPLDRATVSHSKPSLATGHEKAVLEEEDGAFSLLPEAGAPRAQSNLWNTASRTRGALRHTNEHRVQAHVVAALEDVLAELGLSHAVDVVPEVETFKLRPDAWVMTVRDVPIGVVEVKNPGDKAMTDPRVIGELFDYMMVLPNFCGTKQCFGILTTYKQWRVCWLDDDASKAHARASVKLEPEYEFKTPEKEKQGAATEEKTSPEETPSKKRATVHPLDDTASEESEEDEEGDVEEQDRVERKLKCTRVYDITRGDNGPLLFRLLASAIWKMWTCERTPLPDPFANLDKRTLRMLSADSFVWSRLPEVKPKWNKMPTKRAKYLWVVEDLGHGVEGNCLLVTTKTGLIAVLKFFSKDAQVRAETEKKAWHKVYPQFKEMVRVEKWDGEQCLVMPHFSQSVRRDQDAVAQVENTLRDDYLENDMMQPLNEVRWRNIGFYQDAGRKRRAVVLDMSHVVPVSRDFDVEEWIQSCKAQLKERAGLADCEETEASSE